jgi:O-antigen/teichoic acid export membrane protein
VNEREAPAVDGERPARTRVARNALYLVIGQVATTILAIVANGALGRSLGAADFGLFFLISSFASLANVLVDWGQQFYGIREVARAPDKGGQLLGTGLVLRATGTVAVCMPVGLAVWALGYDVRTRWFTVAFIALNLPLFLAQFFNVVFRGRDRMELDSTVSVVNKSIALALTLGALHLGLGIGGVMVAQGLAGAVSMGVAALLYGRIATDPVRFSRRAAREMLVGGTAFAMMSLAVYVQPYIDAVLLSKMVPRDTVGWYGAAKTIMGVLFAPAGILATAAFPSLSRAAATPSGFARELRAALRPMLWLGGLAAVGTSLFADTAIRLVYGHRQFGPAADILRVFGPGLFLIFIDMLLGTAMAAMNRAAALSIVKMGSVVLSTVLDVVFIPYFQHRSGNGGIGVVLAFILSEVAMFGGAIALMPRGTVPRGALVDGARAIAAGGLTAALFRLLPTISPWLAIPLCIIAFTILSLSVGLLRRSDAVLLHSAVRNRLKRIVVAPPNE